MAVQISRLAILLGVDQKGLATGLAKSQASIKSFGSFVSKTLSTAFGVASGIGIVRGFDALTTAVKSQFGEIDRLAKTADRLGLAVDQLQAIELAASLAGIETTTLAKSFVNLQRRISEGVAGLQAGGGINASQRTLGFLGLDPAELAKLNPEAAFARVIKSLQAVENQNDKTRVAVELFGRTGIDLLTLNAEQLEKVLADYDKLGFSLTRLDAAKVEAANDAFTRMGIAINGIAQRLTVAVSPAIEDLVDVVTNGIANAGETFFARIANDIERAGRILGLFLQQFASIKLFGDPGEFSIVTQTMATIVDGVKLIGSSLAQSAELLNNVSADLLRSAFALGLIDQRTKLQSDKQFFKSMAAIIDAQAFFSDLASGSELLAQADEAQAAAEKLRVGEEAARSWIAAGQAAAENFSTGFEQSGSLLSLADQLQTEFAFAIGNGVSSGATPSGPGQSGFIGAGTVAAEQLRLAQQDPLRNREFKIQEDQLAVQRASAASLAQLTAALIEGAPALGLFAIP